MILSEFGHTAEVWYKQWDAKAHLLKTYFDAGVVDDSKFTYAPMDFHIGLGYAAIVKLGLAGIVLVLAILILFGLLLGKLRIERLQR